LTCIVIYQYIKFLQNHLNLCGNKKVWANVWKIPALKHNVIMQKTYETEKQSLEQDVILQKIYETKQTML